MRGSVALAVALGVALAVSAVGVRVEAQSSSEVAAARRLFQEGLEAARGGAWDEAVRLFERSYAIAPRPSTQLNLAGALAQTGRLVAASEAYRGFIHGADRRSRRFVPRAEAELHELEERLAHVTLRAPGLEDDDAILLGDRELSRAVVGVEMPVDPGAAVFVVRRDGREVTREALSLAEGESREVTLRVVPEVRAEAGASAREVPAAALEADPATDDGGGDDTGLIVGVTVAAVVAVAAAVIIPTVVVLESQGPFQGDLGDGVITFE